MGLETQISFRKLMPMCRLLIITDLMYVAMLRQNPMSFRFRGLQEGTDPLADLKRCSKRLSEFYWHRRYL